jgi:polysaccharide export outer membrane protein
MAGGAKYPAYEIVVSVTRWRAKMQAYLQEVIDKPETFNVPISAGDAVLLVRKQQKFLAFGAVIQTGEQAFRKETLKLSDGLGQVMGLDPNRSDAKGIYLFRREPLDLARRYGFQPLTEDRGTMPIVYRSISGPQVVLRHAELPDAAQHIYVSAAPPQSLALLQILSGATATVAIPRTLLGNYYRPGTDGAEPPHLRHGR